MSWPRKLLGDLCSVITKGSTPTSYGMAYVASGVPFLRVQNLDNGLALDRDVLFVSEETHQASARSKILPGDVLLSIAGTIGRSAIVPETAPPLNCNQAVAIIRISGPLDRNYLRNWLQTPDAQNQMRGAQVTATISNLSLTQVGRLEVPLPPLEEQLRITALLGQANALRAKRRHALAKLGTLTQSLFSEVFASVLTNGTRHNLSELIEEFRYGTSNKSEGAGYPALRIPNVIGGSLNLQELKLVPADDAEFERLQLRDGDLLFVRTNGNPDFVGRCAVFQAESVRLRGFDPARFIYASYLIRARLKTDVILPLFLQEFLAMPEGRRALRSRCKTSAGQYNINTEGLGALPVPVPPLTLQRKFEKHLAVVTALKAAQQRALLKHDALFASLQHRAFNGEL